MLRSQMFSVRVVKDGWRTHDEALIAPPTAFVIDSALTCMDAVAFCNLVRGTERMERIPLIVADEAPQSETRIRAFAAGASDCIVLPFMPEELVARLRLLIEIGRRDACQTERAERQLTNTRGAQVAVELIDREGPARWSVRSLARRVGVSERRLTDEFRESWGMSATEYLRREKMERAAWLLRNSGVAVGVVARQVGFPSPCNFSVAFKRFSGMSPSEFRNEPVCAAQSPTDVSVGNGGQACLDVR
ncbi:AraC family transcriptional regulator [Pandoraea anapnoica]|uniref:AraC family transcriptional regulator n=2 Tax=Burkholderiaceae TaxID=119060 RepID=A0A5E5AL17_9BURK|nr:AraC family transcriptional regulator [Pandoraea iniqua]VVE73223.1 AraC family transcriptional regulator [Pandoraea anapnoica]